VDAIEGNFSLKITLILERYHTNLIVISRNIYLALFVYLLFLHSL